MQFLNNNLNDYVVYISYGFNIFKINKDLGFKTSPDIGAIYQINNLSLNLLYAYDFPVLMNSKFNLNRNRIALKLGYILN